MKKRPNPEKISRDNPEWTRAMLAKARPAREVLPKIFGARAAAAMLKPRGRPKSPDSKVAISLRLIATFESGDLGRPRGLSMAAAARAPKIFGRTSRAGRALASIALVHSGLSRLIFSGLGRFFIPFHLAFVGFTQTDDPGFAAAGCEY